MNKLYLTDEQLRTLSTILDLYTHLSLGQFWYLEDIPTIDAQIDYEKSEEFRKRAIALSNYVTGMYGNASHGIFNECVTKDVKFAAHLHQTVRHEFWKRDTNSDKPLYVNSAYPADIWSIAYNQPLVIKIEKDETTGE